MSLASIVSSIVKKEPKVDRKKMAYFLKDFDRFKRQTYSVRILLSILKPDNVVIIDSRVPQSEERTDDVLKYLQGTIAAIFPDTKVDTVTASYSDEARSLVLDEKSTLTQEYINLTELGFFINSAGEVKVYKGTYVPDEVKFHVEEPTEESIGHYLKQDVDSLLPTEGMFLVNELTRNRKAKILIYYFTDTPKNDIINKVTAITGSILYSSIKATIQTCNFANDFQGWGDEKETVNLTGEQYDYILVLRNDRIDIHLPFENGHVTKEPNGWLLLN